MTYDQQHAAMMADLLGKYHRGDWHGVSDAANDLRCLEAAHGMATDHEPALRSWHERIPFKLDAVRLSGDD